MSNHYIIFEKSAHSIIHFVQGDTLADAVWRYITIDHAEAVRQDDGSVIAWGAVYAHPLDYVERWSKVQGEWQIRELPEWAWTDRFAQVFIGESPDGPPSAIDSCLPKFRKSFPKAEAEAFVWRLKTGALVTFYQEKDLRLKILKRYLYDWNGEKETIVEWKGDGDTLAEEMDTRAYRLCEDPNSTKPNGGVGF